MNVSGIINILNLLKKGDTILYTIDSRYGPLNPENEICKGRNYRDAKYFSDLSRIMSDGTRNFNFSRWSSVESVETVLSNLFHLRLHQHGQNRRNERHTQWITCGVDYFHRFHKHQVGD